MRSLIISIRNWLTARINPTPRQHYVSDELCHFVGRNKSSRDEQFEVLIDIIQCGYLSPHPARPNTFGNVSVASNRSITDGMYSPEMVCFCDIPVDQLKIHCSKYSPFGLSFSKRFVAERGGRPVFYVPRDGKALTSRDLSQPRPRIGDFGDLMVEENLGTFFDRNVRELSAIVDRAWSRPGMSSTIQFLNFHILSYFKFFDLNLDDADEKNYYLEREWRIVGKLEFKIKDIQRVLVPKEYAGRFSKRFSSIKDVELL